MNNPRNLIASQDIIDNLSSSESELPLSANQGRILEEQIQQLNPTSDVFFSSSVEIGFDSTIAELEIGSLNWSGVNNQLTFTLKGDNLSALTNINLYNTTDNFDVAQQPQTVSLRGDFGANLDQVYFFSSNGSVDSQYSLNESNSKFLIATTFIDTLGTSSYFLNVEGSRDGSGIILIKGSISKITNPQLDLKIAFRFEANTLPATGGSLFSYGSRENSENVGLIMPRNINFTQISLTQSFGFLAVGPFKILMLKNGSSVKTINYKTGVTGEVVDISPAVPFSSGDVLSFEVGGNFPNLQNISLGAILYGNISGQ
jgi:hypothetical protein